MKRTLAAAILTVGLAAASPLMAQGVSQLQESVTNNIAQLGISTENVDMLTLRQLQEIELVVNGTTTNDEQRNQVESIMGDMAMAPATTGTMSTGVTSIADMTGLEDAVNSDLANLGVGDNVDVSMLTVGQLSQLNLVMNGQDSDDVMRGQVRKILGLE